MRTRAIILKKLPLREDDELVVCYTEHQGKQRCMAKSSLLSTSKQGSHLDILNEVEFTMIEGKHNHIIASAMAIRTFASLKSSLASMMAAFDLLKLFDQHVFENEEDPKLWQFLTSTLARLDAGEAPSIEQGFMETMGYGRI